MDAAERIRALHVPHDNGSADCWPRCEVAHPGVQVCNADDYRWPCPTIRALDEDPPVQCWHTEPSSPCDWDVCRQPDRLAAGDRGVDPRDV
jgi:hypothetical protein